MSKKNISLAALLASCQIAGCANTGSGDGVNIGYTFKRDAYDYARREIMAIYEQHAKDFYPEDEILFQFAKASDFDRDGKITLEEIRTTMERERELIGEEMSK